MGAKVEVWTDLDDCVRRQEMNDEYYLIEEWEGWRNCCCNDHIGCLKGEGDD
jgi:hypothetical protein